MAARKQAKARVPLSVERVVQTAVDLADRAGFEGLTMRTLADELGVVPMALYKHVANKEDLLDAMIDVVFAEIAFPSRDWKAAMRQRAMSMRAALLRHRWAIGRMEGRMRPGPASMRYHNAVMGCLREAGFSFATAVHAYSMQDSYIYGFALQERALPFETPEESAKVAEAQASLQPSFVEYPYLREVVVELGKAGYDYDVEFEVGLDLILEGIEKLRPAWAKAASAETEPLTGGRGKRLTRSGRGLP